MDFEAQDDGVLAKILVDGGDGKELDVGLPICVVVEDEDDVDKFGDFTVSEEVQEVKEEDNVAAAGGGGNVEAAPSSVSSSTAADHGPKPERVVADEFVLTPAARHLSQSKNVDATYLEGTGRDGRVTKGDVILALKNGIAMPPLPQPIEETVTSLQTETATASVAPTPAAVNTPTTSSTPPQVTIPTIVT